MVVKDRLCENCVTKSKRNRRADKGRIKRMNEWKRQKEIKWNGMEYKSCHVFSICFESLSHCFTSILLVRAEYGLNLTLTHSQCELVSVNSDTKCNRKFVGFFPCFHAPLKKYPIKWETKSYEKYLKLFTLFCKYSWVLNVWYSYGYSWFLRNVCVSTVREPQFRSFHHNIYLDEVAFFLFVSLFLSSSFTSRTWVVAVLIHLNVFIMQYVALSPIL